MIDDLLYNIVFILSYLASNSHQVLSTFVTFVTFNVIVPNMKFILLLLTMFMLQKNCIRCEWVSYDVFLQNIRTTFSSIKKGNVINPKVNCGRNQLYIAGKCRNIINMD